jgi:hypothetical protein
MDVIKETVVHRRPDAELRVRILPLHGLREDVTAAVAELVEVRVLF